ncbi:hypothetical protein NXW64_05660 [Bacteroides ovatus]|nr:hypothetical protein [Bacteroides ovatus]MCS3252204.1 hypothetical protein [Bacteroides ovatus]UVO70522.1 hypothetical protein NXW64_05660 [Bacteroides ovatus]
MWSSSFTMGYSKNEIKNSMQQPQINTLVGITGGNKNGYPVNGLFLYTICRSESGKWCTDVL